MKYTVVLLALAISCCQASESLRKFPDEFLLGVATASYQIEGAWNEDGKGESIWDRLTHTRPSLVWDQSNGDVADDSYHKYKRDVEMMRELNLDAYRFSFSWSRILPTGFPNKVNPAGIEYYNNLINEMLKYNIQPLGTLYHWDLPQPLQELGGFVNPSIVDWFTDYAKVVYENFGDRVKLFITFNEPREICYEGYESVNKAPAINSSGIAPYLCAKTLLLAHAKAYHLYDEEFRSQFGGICGITISTNNFEPAAPEFEEVAELKRQAEFGLYANPIFNGDFPQLIKEQVAKKSAAQGFPRSRLPELTKEEIEYIKGTSDFFGMNHYATMYVYRNTSVLNVNPVPSLSDDIDVGGYQVGEASATDWLYFAPKSLYNSLIYAKKTYNDRIVGTIYRHKMNHELHAVGCKEKPFWFSKGENIWDRLTHTRQTLISDQSNGDVAADSYHNYKRDVEMMRELNLDAYRFSFSWSRILPTGFSNKVNPAGIEYYNNLINEMLKYNIQPIGTLYHWDLPQPLSELGGFINPLIVDWFADYARVVYQNFGDRVKLFINFNEPREICYDGYESLGKAPAINATGIGPYLCAKHLVLAHAKAYHLYDEEFRSQFGGKCGISISTHSFLPAAPEYEEVTELMRQAEFGLYANPVFLGDFPQLFKEQVARKSAAQGFPRSRLPQFTDEEIEYTKGTSDFYGINHYTEIYVYRNTTTNDETESGPPSFYGDISVDTYKVGEKSVSDWLVFAPKSLYNAMKYIKETYNDPEIYVTENGWSTLAGLEDDTRSTYIQTHLNGVLDAIDEGVKVKSYMAWSLLDNFEWARGYEERFGLYEVDFEDPARTRTPRKSAFIYKEIARTRTVDPDFEPEVREMWIDEGH